MRENAMYFGTNEIYKKIRSLGGVWNDSKERPLVCLIESTEIKGLFWAIPVGKWDHRDDAGKKRYLKFMSYPENDLRSCYYHLGNTTTKSIFFISDVIPITYKYIEREYTGYDNNLYIIKNHKLVQAITDKLLRILAFESSKENYFRQRITDIKRVLISELEKEKSLSEVASEKE
jgi:hypothetical protein